MKNNFFIFIIDDLLYELKRSEFFSKIDHRSDYHQIRMHTDAILLTAFRNHEGLYEFIVMPLSSPMP
jgi:hypothetical protein